MGNFFKHYQCFREISEKAIASGNFILEVISEGKKLSEVASDEYLILLNKLSSEYSLLKSSAEEILGGQEKLSEDISVNEIFSKVKEVIAQKEKLVLECALHILSLIISVNVEIERYQKEWETFSSMALDEKSEIMSLYGNKMNCAEFIRTYSARISMYANFLDLLVYADKDSNEADEMFKKVHNDFNPIISRGLMRDAFTLGDAESNDEFFIKYGKKNEEPGYTKVWNSLCAGTDELPDFGESSIGAHVPDDSKRQPEVEKSNEKADINVEKTASVVTESERSDIFGTCDVGGNIDADNVPSDWDNQAVIEKNDEKLSEFTFKDKLAESGFFSNITPTETLIEEKSPAENKKITSSIAANEFKRVNTKLASLLINQVLSIGIIEPEAKKDLDETQKKVYLDGVNSLYSLGYLRKIQAGQEICYYTYTERLTKALCYAEVANLLSSKQLKKKNYGIELDIGITYHLRSLDRLYPILTDKETNVSIKSYADEGFYLFKIKTKSQNISVFGGFFDENSDYVKFEDFIKNELPKFCDSEDYIVTSFDKEHAALLVPLLKGNGIISENAVVQLYSFSDDMLYKYPELTAVSVEDKNESCETESQMTEEKFEEQQRSSDDTEISIDDNEKKDENPEKAEEISKIAAIDFEKLKKVSTSEETGCETTEKKPVEVKTEVALSSDEINAVKENAFKMILDGRIYAALSYLRIFAVKDEYIMCLYQKLAYAFNDPAEHCTYRCGKAFDLSVERDTVNDTLMIAAALRFFFSGQIVYDYDVKKLYSGISEYPILKACSALSKVVYSIMDFKNKVHKGMELYADYRGKDRSSIETELEKLKHDAAGFYNQVISAHPTDRISMKRFVETKRLLFNPNGDLGQHLSFVKDGNSEMLELTEDFLINNFIAEGCNISEESVSEELVWNYICGFWEDAGENMMMKRRSDLKSRLRSNITSTTLKAVEYLVRWCVLNERLNDNTVDDGTIEYGRERAGLLNNISSASDFFNDYLLSEDTSVQDKAGYSVLVSVLWYLRKCIDGSYDDNIRKYMYAPFLLTDDIMLTDTYIPDTDVHSSDIEMLLPQTRILAHIEKIVNILPDYPARLEEMCVNNDNIGAGILLADFIIDTNSDVSIVDRISEIKSKLREAATYAKDFAAKKKDEFKGELELAQSYGQIDNSKEDTKEKYIQIVEGWFEWAECTNNYSFFTFVMESYINEIKKSAKVRESVLLEQLRAFRETETEGLDSAAKEGKCRHIMEAIKEQNYSVAEDILAHATADEGDYEDSADDEFLNDFLDHYETYYVTVSKSSDSLSNLLRGKASNRNQKSGQTLIDSWMTNGSPIGKNKLQIMLTTLGFNIRSIETRTSVVRYEKYEVTLAAKNGDSKTVYTHPIYAFGSLAESEPFTVLCIPANYTADSLINFIKQYCQGRNTLILLDCALTKSDRRLLARKVKTTLGDKPVLVIDRVVYNYLIKNYDNTKINRMLMALITPFGYFQPYVWESSTVMPPEMFVGRKQELEKIKSPSGVNIVYGGRQLGKSKLLQKAQEDINDDEHGNKAVYLEIKDLNCAEAEKKVARELYDRNILSEEIVSGEWQDLARALKKRLQSDEKRIPYLLLLMDEADAFIESCGEVNYAPLDALKEVQNCGIGRFKFVIAGLRNIVRFKREAAIGNNSVIAHLEALTVKPFSASEGRALMEIPLHYLGLRFPKEKESLITLILATSNYFPGLIQMYCSKLIAAMRDKDYAGYDEADTPEYIISEDNIKKILTDKSFTDEIREKYMITLHLGNDDYYYLIALIIAYLYHANGYSTGFSAEQIIQVAKEYGIKKIAELDTFKLTAFMEEMKELNILRSNGSEYLFTRFSFFQMLGTATDIDDKLVEKMEE